MDYEDISDMVRTKINPKKSRFLILGDRDVNIIIIKRIMGYTRGKFPESYIGIPLRSMTIKKEDWRALIDRVIKRLERW